MSVESTETSTNSTHATGGEMRLTLLLLLFSFFGLGLPRVFTSTAAHTLFIETYGPEMIPYAYVMEALLVPLFGHLYMAADERFSLRQLIAGSMAVDLIMLVALWLGFSVAEFRPVAFVAMVWFETEFVFCSLWLWGMAGQLMTIRQGKRLFGYISAGEPTAVILGGALTPFALHFVGPKDLFLFSAAGVALGIALVFYITARFTPQREAASDDEEEASAGAPVVAKRWYADRYVQVLVGIVVISQFGYFFTDSAFYLEAGARFPDEAELGAFIGKYMAAVGCVSLVTSLFITRPLVGRFGLRGALLLLPTLLGAAALAASISGIGFGAAGAVFWLAVAMKTVDQSVRYTVDKTSSVTLYQPLPAAQRNQVQTALESIIEPLVGGASGLLLALLIHFVGFDAVGIVTMTFVVAATWWVLVLVQDRYYRQALRTAMYARRFGSDQLAIEEPEAIAAVKEALGSPVAGRVLNALSLADQIESLDRTAYYRELLHHAAPQVRQDVLRRIEALGPKAVPDAWIEQCVAAEFDPAVRAAALRTLAAIDPPRAVEHLRPLLDAPDDTVRREAFVGLLRHGGIEGVLCAGEPLLGALRSADSSARRFAASVLEGAAAQGFTTVLLQLLADHEPSVRAAALRAVAGARSAPLWPEAAKLLAHPSYEVSRTAADVLVAGGDAAVPALALVLDDAHQPRDVRKRAARVLGDIGTAMACHELLTRLGLPDRSAADAVLHAVPVDHVSHDPEGAKLVRRRLADTLANAARATAWRASLAAAPIDGVDAVLTRALGTQIEDDLRALLRLLALLFPKAGLGNAWANYSADDSARRGVVLEAIDTVLRDELRVPVLALLEHETDITRLDALPADQRPALVAATAVPDEVVRQPATVVTAWTRAAALYTLARTAGIPNSLAPALLAEPLCHEIVNHAPAERSMLTIEKVLTLRNTPIFAAVREEHLVDVAQRAEPVELKAGETLFRQGDAGNSMFVVVDGNLRIHVGERTLAELGAQEVVGEMAAVDPEPRSATVTALVDTILLRISNQNLELLIDHDPDVARGIIRVLCGRLRGAAGPVRSAA